MQVNYRVDYGSSSTKPIAGLKVNCADLGETTFLRCSGQWFLGVCFLFESAGLKLLSYIRASFNYIPINLSGDKPLCAFFFKFIPSCSRSLLLVLVFFIDPPHPDFLPTPATTSLQKVCRKLSTTIRRLIAGSIDRRFRLPTHKCLSDLLCRKKPLGRFHRAFHRAFSVRRARGNRRDRKCVRRLRTAAAW